MDVRRARRIIAAQRATIVALVMALLTSVLCCIALVAVIAIGGISATTKTSSVQAVELKREEVVAVEEAALDPEKIADKIIYVTATAYCTCPKCCGIWSAEHESRIGTGYVQTTYSGTIPTEGRTIAVDPDVIPLGSTVVADDREYIAEDIGGAIKGDRIDFYFDSHEEALAFGCQKLTVEVFMED